MAAELRDKFLNENEENISKGVYEEEDVNKVRTDIEFVELYLTHLKGDCVRALKFMHTSLEWRKSFAVKDLCSASFLPNHSMIDVIFFCNKDKNGQRILHVHFSKMKKDSSYSENAKKYLVWQLEKAFVANRGQRIVVLMDMSGAGIANVDMNFIKFLIGCFTSNYPCLLGCLLIAELPWILNAAWSVIKTWLNPEQQKFVVVVKKSSITKHISPDQLFTHLGGTSEFPTFPPASATESVETVVESSTEVAPRSSPVPAKRRSKSLRLDKQLSEQSSTSLNEFNETSPLVIEDQSKSTINYVSIYPAETIVFERGSQSGDAGTFLTITNRSSCAVAYKVKTTSPDIFRVRPIMGILQPNSYKKVSVTLVPGKQCNAIKDKFLVMLMMLRDDIASKDEGNVGNLWKTLPRNQDDFSERRLSCRVVEEVQQNRPQVHSMPNGHVPQSKVSYDEVLEQLKLINRNQMVIAILLLVVLLKIFIYPH